MAVALAAYALDQGSKFFVERDLPLGEPVQVWGDALQFLFVRNPGAAFSLASGSTWIFSVAATAVTVFIVLFARRIRSLPWAVLFGMLLGGTVGNLTDRLFREPGFGVGHVVDFIQVKYFPAVFNIADSFIVASMGLFIILSLRGIRLDGTHVTRANEPETDQSAVPSDAVTDGSSRRHDDSAPA